MPLNNSTAEATAAIRRLAEAWHAGWEAGNAEALLDLYAADPVLIPENQPAIRGRLAILNIYRSVFKDFVIAGSGEIQDVLVDGALGCLWSAYQLTATPRNSQAAAVHGAGNSLFILRRHSDGAWKITHLMSNSVQPTPAA